MKFSVRPDSTLNWSIRRHSEMTEPPRPEPVWVDSLTEEQMRDGICHGLTRAACCSAGFGEGGAPGPSLSLLWREFWSPFLKYGEGFWSASSLDTTQVPTDESSCEMEMCERVPLALLLLGFESVLCQNKRKAYTSLYSSGSQQSSSSSLNFARLLCLTHSFQVSTYWANDMTKVRHAKLAVLWGLPVVSSE